MTRAIARRQAPASVPHLLATDSRLSDPWSLSEQELRAVELQHGGVMQPAETCPSCGYVATRAQARCPSSVVAYAVQRCMPVPPWAGDPRWVGCAPRRHLTAVAAPDLFSELAS